MTEPRDSESEAALRRVRAAVAAGATSDVADVALVLAALDQALAESAARWQAIGRLAPAAKAQRGRADDALRLLHELRAAAAEGADLAPLLARIATLST